MPYSAGSNITAADINALKDKVNTTATRIGYAALGTLGTVGNQVASNDIQILKNKLTEANNDYRVSPKADLTTIANYAVGNNVLASLLNTIETKSTEVYNNTCTCNCNYCSCNCNNCSCNCNYSCTCNCNYSCTCNCNYSCTCNCNNCGCYCAHSDPCAFHTCVLPEQLIYTSTGVKMAKDIETGEYLLASDGTYEEVYTKWELLNTREKLGVITGRSYVMKLTDDHPIWVFSGRENSLVKADPEGLMSLEVLEDIKVLMPKIQKNKANFDEEDNFFYRKNVKLGQGLVKLLPYLLLRTGTADNGDTTISFNAGEEFLMKRASSHLQETIQVHFKDHNNVLIIDGTEAPAGIPISEIVDSIIGHGIPNWFYNYDSEKIAMFLDEMQLFNPNMIFPTKEMAYQIRMAAAQIGVEAAVLEEGDQWKIDFLGDMQEFEDFYLMDVLSVEIIEYKDAVYNFVMNERHTYVGEAVVGDGFYSPEATEEGAPTLVLEPTDVPTDND